MSITVFKPSQKDRDALDELRINPATLLDDGVSYAGKTVLKPWGHQRESYQNSELSVWRLSMIGRSETSFHAHLSKDVVMMVSEGAAIVETFNGKMRLVPGSLCIIEKGVFHRTSALESAVIIEVETSSNRKDLVRLTDRYGRAGKAY